MISFPGSLSFAKLVMMPSAPAKSAGDTRYAFQDPFIQCHIILTPIYFVFLFPPFKDNTAEIYIFRRQNRNGEGHSIVELIMALFISNVDLTFNIIFN